MKKLRSFHEEHLSVEHTFSLFDQIAYYESLWEGEPSVYRDYSTTKAHVLELEAYLEAQPKVWTLLFYGRLSAGGAHEDLRIHCGVRAFVEQLV